MTPQFTKRAEKELASLNREDRNRVIAALDKLQTDPRSCDLKKLKGQSGIWRLRVGDLRILLRPDEPTQILYIMGVRPRKDAYR